MRARSIMVQGTMSDVGKSLIVAGLCRVFAQEGMRVAPFKSQNMALNSAVTQDGLEIGRAQALQAAACGIEPTADMNPVLLKPTSDTGSQVVVRGKARATMGARDYFAYKRALMPEIRASYEVLAKSFDLVVIEGAGSPVELNLKADDVVNMGIAKMARSPVLLVGDIDRGGVFAQLVGTMDLLDEDERALVKATVVNKFRGDATLFADGLDILRARTGVLVAGLVPYLDLELDDEDSLSPRLGTRMHDAAVDVAVVRLPHISNFTDFAPLSAAGGAGVRYVTRPEELGHPDLVIIPGTKSTMADLLWMRSCGLEAAVVRAQGKGVPVLGICGGYQMMGRLILDPAGVERRGELAGMGLLPVRTVFWEEKRTVRSRGSVARVGGPLAGLGGCVVEGYEIHAGETVLEGGEPLLRIEGGDGGASWDGCQHGSAYGCYLHGLFDRAEVVRALLGCLGADGLLGRAGSCQLDWGERRERELDRLADALRAHMDLDLVRRIIEEGT